MFVNFVFSFICAIATIIFNRTQKIDNYCLSKNSIICLVNQFRICANNIQLIKMSLAQDTFCEIFNKNILFASLNSLISIKSNYFIENAKVINQFIYNIFVSFDVLDDQSTISFIFFAIQISSNTNVIYSLVRCTLYCASY